MAWIGNLIRRGLQIGDANPTRVVEVKSEKYSDRSIISREDSIVLYNCSDNEPRFEIIMHRPCSESLSQAFSLFRSEVRTEAEDRFIILKDKLPFLCNVSSISLGVIQKYCTVLQDNPSWNICHLIVYFNLIDAVTKPEVISHINAIDPINGISPLQLAVKEGNLNMLVKLMQNSASLGHLDHEGNSVFHFAATQNRDIINALSSGDTKSLNIRNLNGQTPLHVACLNDKPECVTALLVSGADVNLSGGSPGTSTTPPGLVGDLVNDYSNKLQPQEMKYGGTPLHWAASKEVIDALLDRNCDIDALNFASRTALHVMVLKNRLECVVALLSREADMSIADSNGDTALHLAVKERNIPIVQALIVFGADLALLNNDGMTARHLAASDGNELSAKILYILHAVGAPRCPFLMASCHPGCAPEGTENGIPPPPAPGPAHRAVSSILQSSTLTGTPSKGCRLLCLDGGGIRGLVLVTLLLHLEAAVGKPIIHCFDWVAATSTGAILALALAAGKSLKECLCLYFRMKDQAFAGFRPYASEPLETMLKETLGTDTTMIDVKHPKLMIVGCLADRKPVDIHLFRNYEGSQEILGVPLERKSGPDFEPLAPYDKQLLWEAARASGAAPSYFRAFGRFVDGGLIGNNPTLDALTEIHEVNTALRHMGRGNEAQDVSIVVSLGTGSVPLTKVDNVDVFWPSGIWETAKAVSGMRSMQAVLVDQATLSDGRLIDRTRALCSMLAKPYFRFSPQLSEDIAMDEKGDVKLVNMLWETKAYIMSQDKLVNRLATLL
ncbi:85/88 kDa calcium-independent phospholipase A2 [Halyomorpha halys]|uniref:85/88 kDa calcium-independent phospholipase A2 n=1 Tax=Halyomorpha halys TaxID=286706 RepID=UPI0006D5249F|nr:85/88 kDa calcium-independent phospholipase A2 [Halyomorpha halys]